MDFQEYYQRNKSIYKKRNVERYQTHRKHDSEVWRNNYYQGLYGISITDYNRMLENQGQVCGVCKLPCSRRLSVDHCHETGKVRGLLCIKCNRGIGNFNDDVTRLKAAVKYLENQNSSND